MLHITSAHVVKYCIKWGCIMTELTDEVERQPQATERLHPYDHLQRAEEHLTAGNYEEAIAAINLGQKSAATLFETADPAVDLFEVLAVQAALDILLGDMYRVRATQAYFDDGGHNHTAYYDAASHHAEGAHTMNIDIVEISPDMDDARRTDARTNNAIIYLRSRLRGMLALHQLQLNAHVPANDLEIMTVYLQLARADHALQRGGFPINGMELDEYADHQQPGKLDDNTISPAAHHTKIDSLSGLLRSARRQTDPGLIAALSAATGLLDRKGPAFAGDKRFEDIPFPDFTELGPLPSQVITRRSQTRP